MSAGDPPDRNDDETTLRVTINLTAGHATSDIIEAPWQAVRATILAFGKMPDLGIAPATSATANETPTPEPDLDEQTEPDEAGGEPTAPPAAD